MNDVETNKKLCDEFPFLIPHNVWTDEVPKDYNYEYTWIDSAPSGWKNLIIECCKEIKPILEQHDWLDKYRITQIKEKWGGLRWYDFGAPSEVHNIIYKYELLSEKVCCVCGEPSTKLSTGWILPFCDKCFENENNMYNF